MGSPEFTLLTPVPAPPLSPPPFFLSLTLSLLLSAPLSSPIPGLLISIQVLRLFQPQDWRGPDLSHHQLTSRPIHQPRLPQGRPHYRAQVGLVLMILLPRLPKGWVYRNEPRRPPCFRRLSSSLTFSLCHLCHLCHLCPGSRLPGRCPSLLRAAQKHLPMPPPPPTQQGLSEQSAERSPLSTCPNVHSLGGYRGSGCHEMQASPLTSTLDVVTTLTPPVTLLFTVRPASPTPKTPFPSCLYTQKATSHFPVIAQPSAPPPITSFAAPDLCHAPPSTRNPGAVRVSSPQALSWVQVFPL